MNKKLLLEVEAIKKISNNSPKHFSLILDDKMVRNINSLKEQFLSQNEDELYSSEVVEHATWGTIDSLYYDLPLKDLFHVVSSTKITPEKSRIVLNDDGFYFYGELEGNSFKTSFLDFKELDKKESIIFGISFNPCGKWL